jgi:hypothetical protein
VFILIENDRQSNKLDKKNSKNDDLFAIRIFSDIQKKEERTETEWKKTSTTSIIIGN